MNRVIHFGPPGCGKTTTLLQIMEKELKEGVSPDRIAFLTFTRRARFEAMDRVGKALGMTQRDLPYFRTIHSLAFRGLNLKDGDIMGFKHLNIFGVAMGLKFGKTSATEMAAEGLNSQSTGDVLIAIDNLARVRGTSLKYEWNHARSDVDWPTMEHFSKSYTRYKKESSLLDFTDVLIEFVRERKRIEVDVAFIDEAQDLSALQWLTALQAVEGAQRQHIAGDDDQSIFGWAGADTQFLMNLEGERRILTQSFRLPRVVHALSNRIIKRVKNRVTKEFKARDAEGLIKRHANVDGVDLGSEKWLWLVRNRFLLPALIQSLEQKGIVYTQHGLNSIRDAERDAIYDWERLRAGRSIPVGRVRDIYSFLKTKTQIKHGFKLLPDVDETTSLSIAELEKNHGLLAKGTWFETFQSIPDQRRAYYRKLLRDKKTLKLDPQVQLETIHGAKGAEAPHVALFLEQSRRVWDEGQQDPDAEHRVWYVGATRAIESLHLIEPSGRWGYEMPRIT